MVAGSDEGRAFSKESKTRWEPHSSVCVGCLLGSVASNPQAPQPLVSRSRSQFYFSVMHKKGPPKLRAQITHGRVLAVPSDQHPASVDPICDLFVWNQRKLFVKTLQTRRRRSNNLIVVAGHSPYKKTTLVLRIDDPEFFDCCFQR